MLQSGILSGTALLVSLWRKRSFYETVTTGESERIAQELSLLDFLAGNHVSLYNITSHTYSGILGCFWYGEASDDNGTPVLKVLARIDWSCLRENETAELFCHEKPSLPADLIHPSRQAKLRKILNVAVIWQADISFSIKEMSACLFVIPGAGSSLNSALPKSVPWYTCTDMQEFRHHWGDFSSSVPSQPPSGTGRYSKLWSPRHGVG